MNTLAVHTSNLSAHLKKLLPGALTLTAFGAVGSQLLYPSSPDISLLQLSLTLVAIFSAALLASIAGFAFSALAAAMLIHLYEEPADMVRTMLVCSIAVQLYCSLMVRNNVQWRELAPYLLGGLATAPLGIVILKHVSSGLYALILGAFLLGYAIYALCKPPHLKVRRSPVLDAGIGALGGLTGGLAAFPGAFVVMWCSARDLGKKQQRAICQPYILIMQIATLAWLQYAFGADTGKLLELWTFVPVALLAAYLGFSIFQRISTQQFKSIVLALLGVSGALLVAKGW